MNMLTGKEQSYRRCLLYQRPAKDPNGYFKIVAEKWV